MAKRYPAKAPAHKGQPHKKAARKRPKQERYTEKTLREDREYGFFWYDWLWRFLRPVMIFLCAFVLVAGILVTLWNQVYANFLMPMDPDNDESVTFTIASGESISTISEHLYEQGLLRNKGLFKYIISFQGLTNDIHYGSYQLTRAMDVMDIIDVLASGSETTERTITIIPGWPCEDIADYLVSVGALTNRDEFLAICNQPELFLTDSYALQYAYESAGFANRLYKLEGYLAPDTYRVFANASAQSIARTLVLQTNTVYDRVFYAEDSVQYDEEGNLIQEGYVSPLTMDQTLILASMIEKEAGNQEDFAKVSAVFHNRLNAGMRLESDPTVKYTLGVDTFTLTNEQLATQSAYNTYQISGLPVGPICNPSQAALEAALHPDEAFMAEGYYYFCATEPDSDALAFAKTLEEHNANVERYRPLWEAYDREQQGE